MGFLDMFKRHKEAELPDAVPDPSFGDPSLNNDHLGLETQNPGYGGIQETHDPGYTGIPGNRFAETYQAFSPHDRSPSHTEEYQIREIPQQGKLRDDIRDIKVEKSLEIISSKLDTIKAILDNLDHRLSALERNRPRW